MGGRQLLRSKVVNIVEWSHASKASYLRPGSASELVCKKVEAKPITRWVWFLITTISAMVVL